MRFLVMSSQHSLLPFAHRLTREGHDVESVICNPGHKGKYEGAYAGVIKPILYQDDRKRHKKMEAMKELAADDQCIVISNDARATKDFKDAKNLLVALKDKKKPVGTLRLGAWVDGNDFYAPHLLIVDENLNAMSLGARVDTVITMIRLDDDQAMGLLPDHVSFRGSDFRGLCQWGIELSPSGELSLTDGTVSGWPRLHTHAFVSELENFGEVLNRSMPVLPKKFTVVIAVTKPPWPYPVMHSPGEHPIEGLTDEQIGQVFWHDVKVDQKTRTLSTAGLDGLVGVVRGAADSFELAQARALNLASTMQFPEKQFRPDAGGAVRNILAVLEEKFGVVV